MAKRKKVNETGDMKILGEFRRLLDLIAADPLYNHGSGDLKLTNLEAVLTDSKAAVSDIDVKMAPNKVAINARQQSYKEAISMMRGSRSYLKSSGASAAIIADADTFAQKALGVRISKKKLDDPNTPENEALENHSASQLSYDAILGHFRGYVEIVKNEPLYTPTETKFKVATLDAKGDELETRNNAVSATFVPLSQAYGMRDEKLYTGEKCLCNLAKRIKEYVKGVHGATSQFYKTVNALSFRRK
ncbi:MAG TPA: hypothetical protein PKY59_21600 [Pyrinomonadaceae bacterium]|nr:hypothetical protein [Pyrinomonadaceae bacterium]